MRVGITATREGLTLPQLTRLEDLLRRLYEEDDPIFAHGDCVGGDEEGHDIAVGLGYEPVIFPCTLERQRARKHADTIFPVRPPLDRNKDIVNFSEVMVVCPKGMEPEWRSGTWSTHRYASGRRELYIIYPDGTEDHEIF